jgi:hypothetical protein
LVSNYINQTYVNFFGPYKSPIFNQSYNEKNYIGYKGRVGIEIQNNPFVFYSIKEFKILDYISYLGGVLKILGYFSLFKLLWLNFYHDKLKIETTSSPNYFNELLS